MPVHREAVLGPNPGFVKWSLVALLAALACLRATGFCFQQFRYLPKAELYRAAIEHEKRRIAEFGEGTALSADGYLKAHPDCCSIPDQSPFAGSPVWDFIGGTIIPVRVRYRLSPADVARGPNDQNPFYDAYVEVRPCGTTIHSIGISQDTWPE